MFATKFAEEVVSQLIGSSESLTSSALSALETAGIELEDLSDGKMGEIVDTVGALLIE